MADWTGIEFEGKEALDEGYNNLTTKLKDLGYDVLINQRDKSEFVPSSRLGEVVAQRNEYDKQAKSFQKELETLKAGASGNESLETKIQELMDNNKTLMGNLEQAKVQNALIAGASDAIDPTDIIAFMKKDAVKVNSKGEVTGVVEEIQRLREAKPHLFKTSTSKGGTDPNSVHNEPGSNLDMNSMIRRAAQR